MNNIASFILYAFIIVFVYIAVELASERETKSREGMKMMGLQDGTYYLGWFLLFTFFAVYNSLVGTIMLHTTVFQNINPLLLFLFLILYAFSLFGQAWVFVALLPTTRGVILLVILW
jgi:high-affinity Fe2+/Pb2+ permease